LSTKSSLDDIKFEFNTQKKIIEEEQAVKFYRKMLMGCVAGIVFFNKRYDPLGFKLDGWDEHIMNTATDYDSIFQRIHEKYGGVSGDMDPILELLFAVGGSAI
jgi:hypothetical protein